MKIQAQTHRRLLTYTAAATEANGSVVRTNGNIDTKFTTSNRFKPRER